MDKRIDYKSTSYLGPLFITTPKLGKTGQNERVQHGKHLKPLNSKLD